MRVGLIGTYGVENFGDCLFPELYAFLLAEALPEATVTLFSPRARPAEILSFDKISRLPDRMSDDVFAGQDALILTGGETIGFGHSSGTYNYPPAQLSAYARLWLAPLNAALNSAGKTRFAAHCVGARKMPAEINWLAARALGGAAHVTFRDAFSAAWIRDGDQPPLGQATDPMFLLDRLLPAPDWQARAAAHLPAGFAPGGYLAAQLSLGYAGNALNAWCRSVASIAAERGMGILLLPICHFLEDEHYLALAARRIGELGGKVHLVRGRINVKDTAALISQSGGYLGSSLHGAVTAVAFARPLAAIGHSMDGKHEGTLNSVGIRGCVTTSAEGLQACFAASEAMDLGAIRQRAQAQARADFEEMMNALTGPYTRDTAQIEAARKSIDELARLEPGFPSADRGPEWRRLILRQLQTRPALYSRYHRARIRQRIDRSVR